MAEEEHRKKKAEEDKSTPPDTHKRRRKSPSPTGKTTSQQISPFPPPTPGFTTLSSTRLEQNFTINQSKRSATTGPRSDYGSRSGIGSATVKKETPPVPENPSPAKTSTDTINLKITDQDGNEASYRVKRSTPLSNVLDFYLKHHNLEEGTVKLLFDGRYCHGHQTPDVMGIEDGDEITVVTDQEGGS